MQCIVTKNKAGRNAHVAHFCPLKGMTKSVQREMLESRNPRIQAIWHGAELYLKRVVTLNETERLREVKVIRVKGRLEMQHEDASRVVDKLHILHRLPRLTQLVFADGD